MDAFFFHCARRYTVKGKKQEKAFSYFSAEKCDKVRPP